MTPIDRTVQPASSPDLSETQYRRGYTSVHDIDSSPVLGGCGGARRREDPAPAVARATARREIPRTAFRGVAVADLGWNEVVAASCARFDTRAPRLWGPQPRQTPDLTTRITQRLLGELRGAR